MGDYGACIGLEAQIPDPRSQKTEQETRRADKPNQVLEWELESSREVSQIWEGSVWQLRGKLSHRRKQDSVLGSRRQSIGCVGPKAVERGSSAANIRSIISCSKSRDSITLKKIFDFNFSPEKILSH